MLAPRRRVRRHGARVALFCRRAELAGASLRAAAPRAFALPSAAGAPVVPSRRFSPRQLVAHDPWRHVAVAALARGVVVVCCHSWAWHRQTDDPGDPAMPPTCPRRSPSLGQAATHRASAHAAVIVADLAPKEGTYAMPGCRVLRSASHNFHSRRHSGHELYETLRRLSSTKPAVWCVADRRSA